jgi:hypothetical protein
MRALATVSVGLANCTSLVSPFFDEETSEAALRFRDGADKPGFVAARFRRPARQAAGFSAMTIRRLQSAAVVIFS